SACRLFSEWLSPARMWSTSVATSVHRSPVSTLIHSHRYPARSRTIARMRRQFRGSRSPRLLVLHIRPSTRMEGWGILYGGSLSYAGLPIWGMAFPYAAIPRRLPQNAECSSRSAPGHYTPLPHNITCPGARSPRVGGHFSVPLAGSARAAYAVDVDARLRALYAAARQRSEQYLRWRPLPAYSASAPQCAQMGKSRASISARFRAASSFCRSQHGSPGPASASGPVPRLQRVRRGLPTRRFMSSPQTSQIRVRGLSLW